MFRSCVIVAAAFVVMVSTRPAGEERFPNPDSVQRWYPTEKVRPCVDADNNPIDANGIALTESEIHRGNVDFHSLCRDKVN